MRLRIPARYNAYTMSLTKSDLLEIRTIMREELNPLEGKVVALESDVKEIYFMLGDLQDVSNNEKM